MLMLGTRQVSTTINDSKANFAHCKQSHHYLCCSPWAFKFLLYSYSSSFADEESSGQDQEQKGGDDDDLEGDN
jgi:hypothetical protein